MKYGSIAIVFLFLAACIPLPDAMPSSLPFFAGNAETHSESRSERSEEHWVNGKRVDDDDWSDWEKDEDEPRESKGETVAKRKASDIGATCNRNSDCEMNACLTSGGGLGYCTKMCNSWSDCPTFWKCKRPGNAPQKICMQKD